MAVRKRYTNDLVKEMKSEGLELRSFLRKRYEIRQNDLHFSVNVV